MVMMVVVVMVMVVVVPVDGPLMFGFKLAMFSFFDGFLVDGKLLKYEYVS